MGRVRALTLVDLLHFDIFSNVSFRTQNNEFFILIENLARKQIKKEDGFGFEKN